MDWNAAQYLKFDQERTQVSRDLAQRVAPRLPAPGQIVDLGCGPGNSTGVLARLWPQATITGLDASPTMLASARDSYPGITFIGGDIPHWAATATEQWDLVFSNSALQWVPGHAALLPRLLARVAPGGALAFQVPANWSAAACQLPRDLATQPEWRPFFPTGTPADWHTGELDFFYDCLAPLAAHLELWETEYLHVMPDVESILEWYRGSGLRPYLQALPDEAARRAFLAQYRQGVQTAYPARADGRVLFPFRRRFVIAWQGTASPAAA